MVDLGRIFYEYNWTIPDALDDLHSDTEYLTWSTEQECRQVAARVVERVKRLKPNIVVRVGRLGKEYEVSSNLRTGLLKYKGSKGRPPRRAEPAIMEVYRSKFARA